jgi:hypothetical protein
MRDTDTEELLRLAKQGKKLLKELKEWNGKLLLRLTLKLNLEKEMYYFVSLIC